MISGEVRRKAIFYRALKILEAHIAEPLEDHPAMSRFDRLQDMRAAIDGAEKASSFQARSLFRSERVRGHKA